jgi:hypothetical protein
MKLYTVVVHNLQMCMKEYRCFLKFRKGNNSTYTFTKPSKFWTATIFLHAHLQVVYYKCVKFHINPISGLGEVKFRKGNNSTYSFTKRGCRVLVTSRCMFLVSLFWRWDVVSLTELHIRSFFIGNLLICIYSKV